MRWRLTSLLTALLVLLTIVGATANGIPGLMVPLAGISGPGPAPTVVNKANTTLGSCTSCAVVMPASIVANNELIMFVAWGTGAGITATPPTGWTRLLADHANAGGSIFYKTASGSEGASQTMTLSSGTLLMAITYQINGWSGTPAFASYATCSTTTCTPPTTTPSWGVSNVVSLAVAGGTASAAQTVSSYPASYTGGTVATTSTSPRPYVASAQRTLTMVGSISPGAFTLGQTPTSSGGWANTVVINGM